MRTPKNPKAPSEMKTLKVLSSTLNESTNDESSVLGTEHNRYWSEYARAQFTRVSILSQKMSPLVLVTESAIYSMAVWGASVSAGVADISYSVPPSSSSAKYSFVP